MKTSDINLRDPFVLVHDGRYYLYGSRGDTCWGNENNGFDVYVGDDLENWEGPIVCFENDGTFWSDRNYWAPEVHLWNGRFYMFASFKAENVCRGTAILVADTPTGPFKPHSDGCITPSDWECLDGTFYVDKNGKPYMVFCHEWLQAIDGGVCSVPLTDDLKAPAGEVRKLFNATAADWCTKIASSDGINGYVTDGPFLWRTAYGRLVMLWASFSGDGYTEGLCVSDNDEISGNFIQSEPVFRKDGGHAMLFRALDGRLLMTLHSPNINGLERPCFIEMTETEHGLRKA